MKYFLYICSLCFAISAAAQFKSIEEGEEFTRSKTEAFNGFIGTNEEGLFSIDYVYTSKKKKALIIRKFHKETLSLIDEQDVFTEPLDGYYNVPYEIYLVNNRIYLFSIFTHAKEGTTTLGLFMYDDQLKHLSFEIVDSIESLSQTNLSVQLSEDTSAILISQNHPHKLSQKEVVNLNCLDLDGKSVWKKELVSMNDVHRINVEKIIFPDTGEVFLLCNYGFNNNQESNIDDIRLLSNKYAIWAYNRKLNYLKEINLRLKLKWLNGVDMQLKENGRIVVAGFVNSSRSFAINAFFNIEIDEKYEISANNYYRIDPEIISTFLPKESKKKVLENFYLRDILVQEDGSFYVIGEQYYKYLDRVYDPRTNTTSTIEHFNYEYILTARFSETGELIWAKRIPKIQNSTNDYGYYSSFTSYNSMQNEIYLIYNDYEKNLELPLDDVENLKGIFNGRKNALTYVKINNDGTVFRKQVPSTDNYLLYAKKSAQINKSTMYLLVELGRKSKIIRLSF